MKRAQRGTCKGTSGTKRKDYVRPSVVSSTVPQGHKHRVTTWKKSQKIPFHNTRRDPEKHISSESLWEGCAPRRVTSGNLQDEYSPPICTLCSLLLERCAYHGKSATYIIKTAGNLLDATGYKNEIINIYRNSFDATVLALP